jgi:hypothetical protein
MALTTFPGGKVENGIQASEKRVMAAINKLEMCYNSCRDKRIEQEAETKTEIAVIKIKVAVYGGIAGLLMGIVGSLLAAVIYNALMR